MQFKQFFSLDSPKAIKARSYGYLNAINYMAPSNTAGVGNLCPHASPGCLKLCLGWYSGQAGMVSHQNKLNHVRRSRQAKARMFMTDRKAFMGELFEGLRAAERKARREGLKLCVRLNGASDIAWEGVRVSANRDTIFDLFPNVQFVDYTKNFNRAHRFAVGLGPANYHLTFSRSETNWDDCVRVLMAGGNVAVVFEHKPTPLYRGWTVVDGDSHDLRHLDSQGYHSGRERKSLIIALSPKGARARRDRTGFVVR